MRLLFSIALLSVWFMSCGRASVSDEDFPTRSAELSGTTFKYRLFVPKSRNPNEKIPVMLYLHGSNRRGSDNRSQVLDLNATIKEFPPSFIIVFPQCPDASFWAGPSMDQAMAALDQTVKEFNGDPNSLYLAGYSMGGFGVWQGAVTYPNKFAAVVPIAGGVLPVGKPSEEDMAMLSPAVKAANSKPDIYRAFAEAIGGTPVWAFHGGKDDVVPAEGSRKMVEALRSAGNTNAKYTELEGIGHGSVTRAFAEPGFYSWLLEQKLNRSK